MLLGLGAHVQTANIAEEALARLTGGSFDILISDLAMPGADGYALLRGVRSREGERRRIYALALTGLTSVQDRDAAIAAGFDDHLPKPVNLQLLIEKLSSGGAMSVGVLHTVRHVRAYAEHAAHLPADDRPARTAIERSPCSPTLFQSIPNNFT